MEMAANSSQHGRSPPGTGPAAVEGADSCLQTSCTSLAPGTQAAVFSLQIRNQS